MLIVGIDPGVHGALAGVKMDGRVVFLNDMPTIEVVRRRAGKKTTRHDYDWHGVCAALEMAFEIAPIVIGVERMLPIPARPGASCKVCGGPMNQSGAGRISGATHMHLGRGQGAFEMYAAMNKLRYWPVLPRTWKAEFSLGSDKDEARQLAGKLFPLCEARLQRKKDDGRADALLIAEYVRRKLRDEVLADLETKEVSHG